MSLRVRLYLAVLALCALTLLPACYTLYRHPRLSQLNYRRPDDSRCQTCHASQELWFFTHPSTLPRRAGPWGEFYDVPWWYEQRWQVDPKAATAPGDSVPAPGEGR